MKTNSPQLSEGFYRVLLETDCIRSSARTKFHLTSLCQDITFQDATVLDVGGGWGLLTFYAAGCGAREVVCLEPEAAGSTAGVNRIFATLQTKLGLQDRVRLDSSKFQDFAAPEQTFDVILLHNSVNHLDEPACIDLLESQQARDTYRQIFGKIGALVKPGGKLLVCDCSRYNLFPLWGLRNPFEPTVEWHKHQAPETWIRLLVEAGFHNPRLRWTSFSRLYSVGRILTGNRIAAFCLSSHFCFTMQKY